VISESEFSWVQLPIFVVTVDVTVDVDESRNGELSRPATLAPGAVSRAAHG
jgi:hypothetical protein